jgi:glucose 1-dehydrogenase
MRFANKVVLVTGGGSGIGRAACERFAEENGKVVIVDINEANGIAAVEAIKTAGGEAVFARADVSDSAQVRAAIQTAVEKFGKIDVLVNNAAVMTFDPVTELDEAAWEKVMAVNLRSVFLFCKYALPVMPAGGAIVNVSSVHAHQATAFVVPYATTKGGIEAFTRGLSVECAARKIRVNCVDPPTSRRRFYFSLRTKPDSLTARRSRLTAADWTFCNFWRLISDAQIYVRHRNRKQLSDDKAAGRLDQAR